MTYVVSNLHGEYQKFQDLLTTIRFCESDELYILGDIVDYGPDSMELIADLSVRVNVYPIVGEHDFSALMVLSEVDKMLKGGYQPEPDTLAKMAAWMQEGGEPTLKAFRGLDEEQREGVLEYLEDMISFEELEVKGKRYLLTHAGIADYTPGDDFYEYEPEAFFTESPDPDVPTVENVTLVVGHLPTESGRIERGNGSIFLHCGVENGGKLACLCLENQVEYYV